MPRINKMRRSGLHRQKRFGNRGTGSQYIRTPTNINATRMMLAVRAIKSYTVAVLLPARLHRAAQSRSGGAGRLAQVAGTGRRPQVPDPALWTRGVSGRIAPMRHAGLVAVLVVAGCLFASPPAASSDWELQRQCRTMDDCPGPAGVVVPFSP